MISGQSCHHRVVLALLLLLATTVAGVTRGLPFRVRTALPNIISDSDAKGVVSQRRRRVKLLPLQGIQNITTALSNYEYGKSINDHQNIPIYIAQATAASLTLSMLGKTGDPTLAIAGINACVWISWQLSSEDLQLRRFMNDNFLLHRKPENSLFHRELEHRFKPRQVLLHAFSHKDFDHIASNLSSLVAIGPMVQRYTKWSAFSYASFYIASIYASSLFNEAVYYPLMKKHGPKTKQSWFWRFVPKQSVSLGASGAVSAVLTFCGLTCPAEKMSLDVPKQSNKKSRDIPLGLIAATSFLSDVISPLLKSNGKQSNIGHGAHIGGSLFGATVYIVNRTWGSKLELFTRKMTALLKKLVPVQVTNTFGKVQKFCSRVKCGLSNAWNRVHKRVMLHPVYKRVHNLPLIWEILSVASAVLIISLDTALELMQDDEGSE